MWIRFAAYVIDNILLSLANLILSGFKTRSTAAAAIGVVLSILYFIVLPIFWDGRTIGRKVCHIRLIKSARGSVKLWNLIRRELLAPILYGVTLGILWIVSLFMMGLRRDKKAIHDLMGGTQMIYEE